MDIAPLHNIHIYFTYYEWTVSWVKSGGKVVHASVHAISGYDAANSGECVRRGQVMHYSISYPSGEQTMDSPRGQGVKIFVCSSGI